MYPDFIYIYLGTHKHIYKKYSQLFQLSKFKKLKKAELVNLIQNKQYDAHL